MIQYARQKAAAIRNREFQVGVAEALPFPGDHFDVVVSSLVIHHLPEDLRVRAVEEMRRVLRPGGRLLVAEARNPRHGILSLLARTATIAWRGKCQIWTRRCVAGFHDIRNGEVPPGLRYVTAVKK